MKFSAILIGYAMLFAACGGSDSDDNNNTGTGGETEKTTTVTYNQGGYFIATKTDDGSEWVLQTNSLDADLDQTRNLMELSQNEYTWIFKDQTAVGMVYNFQFAGLGYALRYTDETSEFSSVGEFRIDTRFTTYGFFNGQLVTSVAGQTYKDDTGADRNDGATFCFYNISGSSVTLDHTKTISTGPIAGNGEQVTFSGIVDNGDGTFLTAMVKSSFNQTGTGNGSSIGDVKYPDSVWVAQMDKDLNIKKVYRDDRISYAAGQYRSQMFREIFRLDDGTVYVFSNSFNSGATKPAGALRISKGADNFDADYYFDLQTSANGYKFRRVWHMTDDKFLLEIYNEKNITTISPGHQFAIVDMSERKFQWIEGLPAMNLIMSGTETGGVPMYHNGSIWLPITEYGQDAALYTIDPGTGEAVKRLTVKGAKEIRTIGYIGK